MEWMASFLDYFSWLPDIWGIQLMEVDGKPITLGKVITGMVLFVMGYFICKTMSKEIDKRVLTKLDIDASRSTP